MREAIIKNTKYLQIPAELHSYVSDSLSVEKLSIHHCYNGKLEFHQKHWPNLRFLEFIDCSYMEIAYYAPQPSALQQVLWSHCDSINVGEILGYFPAWIATRIEKSKLIKIKGPIKGEIGWRSLEFDHVLRSEAFQNAVALPVLEIISWRNHCDFFKINFLEYEIFALQSIIFKVGVNFRATYF